ncbi:hypothetical protein DSECCO2_341970 [anaerobic digester metagenome]
MLQPSFSRLTGRVTSCSPAVPRTRNRSVRPHAAVHPTPCIPGDSHTCHGRILRGRRRRSFTSVGIHRDHHAVPRVRHAALLTRATKEGRAGVNDDAPSGQREPHGGSKPLCGKKRGTSSLRGELFLRRELDVDPVLLRVCVRDRLDLRNLPGRRCRLEEVAEALLLL